MKLISSYNGLDEESLRSMSREELIEAILRMFEVKAEYIDHDTQPKYYGFVFNADNLADAFRGRL